MVGAREGRARQRRRDCTCTAPSCFCSQAARPPRGGWLFQSLRYGRTSRACLGQARLWGDGSPASPVLRRQRRREARFEELCLRRALPASLCSRQKSPAFWCLRIQRSPTFESQTQPSKSISSAAFTWRERHSAGQCNQHKARLSKKINTSASQENKNLSSLQQQGQHLLFDRYLFPGYF